MTHAAAAPFDLALSYPQWQGSGRPENLPRGAQVAADVIARFAPLERVALSSEEDSLGGVRHGCAILNQIKSAQNILQRRKPRKLLSAGGDCAVDIAIIDHLHGVHPGLTVIWIDAHYDANTVESSPSGSFHGMPVSAILGAAPEPMQHLLRHPLRAEQFRYVCADVSDDGDRAFQADRGLRWLAPDENFDGPVHIHFDLDVLDPAEFPHLAYTDGRLGIDAGVDLVRRFASTLVGLTITEFAPASDTAAADGAGTLTRLCEAATGVES